MCDHVDYTYQSWLGIYQSLIFINQILIRAMRCSLSVIKSFKLLTITDYKIIYKEFYIIKASFRNCSFKTLCS